MRYILSLLLLTICTSVDAHWTYPGNLAVHLRQTHGVQTAGLSHQQMLNLHDSLHEATRTPQYKVRPLRRLFRR